MKLDMHKAYDRVEWIFLRAMMEKLGFDTGWIDMIMACVSFVRYKVRFNSQETLRYLPLLGGFDKGIPSPHTCSFFVQKGCLVCCSMKKKLVAWIGLECVEMHHQYHISYLLKIL